MQNTCSCLLVAILLSSCIQSETEYIPVNAGNLELQEIMISEFESGGIKYRITEKGILEADVTRGRDISEIGNRIWDTYLPRGRSFNVNPDYLVTFRAQLDQESIIYRSLYLDGLDWTIVEDRDATRAEEIRVRVSEAEMEKQSPNDDPGQRHPLDFVDSDPVQ